jgi:acyl transferase domain-containing protein
MPAPHFHIHDRRSAAAAARLLHVIYAQGAFMKLKLIAAVFAIAVLPLAAQAQKAAKVTKADAERVVKMISADKNKVKIYCDLAKLGDEIDAADQKKDTKKVDELSAKMDNLSKQLGPEYVKFTEGLEGLDQNSKDAQAIGSVLEALDKQCGG